MSARIDRKDPDVRAVDTGPGTYDGQIMREARDQNTSNGLPSGPGGGSRVGKQTLTGGLIRSGGAPGVGAPSGGAPSGPGKQDLTSLAPSGAATSSEPAEQDLAPAA